MTEATGVQKPQTLDELMLAMDVVDTIRHRELLVARELSQGDRDEALKARLREIYRSQGLEVSDAAIEQGIKALKESRFVYVPPQPGLARNLALAWVRRGVFARRAAAVAGLVLVVWGVGYFGFILPQRQAEAQVRVALTEVLPRELQQAARAARVETRDADVIARIDGLERDAKAALGRGDAAGVRESVAALDAIRSQLVETYAVNVVSGQGETSGFWRTPDSNPSARNYYLVVEGVQPDGERVKVTVRSEETGKTEVVSRWGQRVPESFFEVIRADKLDNGIIERNPVGRKLRGEMEPRYDFPRQGGAVTSWREP